MSTHPNPKPEQNNLHLTVNDLPGIIGLAAEIASLQRQLIQSRLRAANLEAAILAALHASEDGDIDPLEFLRDELSEINGGHHGP